MLETCIVELLVKIFKVRTKGQAKCGRNNYDCLASSVIRGSSGDDISLKLKKSFGSRRVTFTWLVQTDIPQVAS